MIPTSLRRYPADVARAFGHAPVEVACALLLAVSFSWAVALDVPEAFRAWSELALVVGIAAAAAWSGTLLHALGMWGARRRWLVSAAGAALAAVLALFFLDVRREAEVWRAATLLVAVLLAVLAAPALGPDREAARRRFRRVNGRLVLRCVGAALYAAALFLGLVLAIAAVDNLFELELDERIFAHVWGWIAFAVTPWIVVGGLPDLVRPVEERSETLAVLHRVSAWLVLPLLAVYYVILWAYAARVLLLDELPRNMVSPLVTAAGVLTALALVLFDRGPADGTPGPLRALRVAPLLWVPLAVLGVYAVHVRIDQYGWTEFRYLRVSVLVALTGLAAAAAVPLLRRRPFPVELVPLAVAALLALSVVGPWSAVAVSLRSQRERLVEGLERSGLLRDGAALPADTTEAPRRVPAEVFRTVASTSRYLVAHFGAEAVSPPLPADLLGDEPEVRDVPTLLGLASLGPEGMRVGRGATLGSEAAVPVEGGSLVRVSLRAPRGPRGPSDGTAVLRDSFHVAVPTGRGVLTADLRPLVAWLTLQGPEGSADLPAERAALPLLDPGGAVRGRLGVFSLYMDGDGESAPRVRNLEGVAVVEERDGG